MQCSPRLVQLFKMQLPAVYDDSLSFYEAVCSMLCELRRLTVDFDANIDQIQDKLDELYNFVHGTAWEDAICAWVNQNLPCIISSVCKFFVFSINDNGNIVVSVPTSWEWLRIGWDTTFGSDTFGHIKIGW